MRGVDDRPADTSETTSSRRSRVRFVPAPLARAEREHDRADVFDRGVDGVDLRLDGGGCFGIHRRRNRLQRQPRAEQALDDMVMQVARDPRSIPGGVEAAAVLSRPDDLDGDAGLAREREGHVQIRVGERRRTQSPRDREHAEGLRAAVERDGDRGTRPGLPVDRRLVGLAHDAGRALTWPARGRRACRRRERRGPAVIAAPGPRAVVTRNSSLPCGTATTTRSTSISAPTRSAMTSSTFSPDTSSMAAITSAVVTLQISRVFAMS